MKSFTYREEEKPLLKFKKNVIREKKEKKTEGVRNMMKKSSRNFIDDQIKELRE